MQNNRIFCIKIRIIMQNMRIYYFFCIFKIIRPPEISPKLIPNNNKLSNHTVVASLVCAKDIVDTRCTSFSSREVSIP